MSTVTPTADTEVSDGCAGFGVGVMIITSVFLVVSIIHASVTTSGWRRRQGLPYVEFTTLLQFFLCFLGNLANTVLVVSLGYSSYLFALNAQNNEVYTLCGTFDVIISIAFLFKLIQVFNIIREQSSIDIFLIDWEKPSANGLGNISAWRSLFIANEWNEIQTCRKINPHFHMLGVLLVLELVSNGNPAFEQTGNTQMEDGSAVTQFTLCGFTYVGIALLQLVYRKIIHERFIKDQIKDFIDLCSISNVSVFILSQKNFGYYIHGRSVHGKADVDMSELSQAIQREKEGLAPRRGLIQGKDSQVFEMAIPHKMRENIDNLYQPLKLINVQSQRDHKHDDVAKMQYTVKVFLQSFFDHALLDLDYVVKDKFLLEKIFGVNFEEATNSAFLTTTDEYAFSEVLYYGNELTLMTFDVLLFLFVNNSTSDFVLATTVTYGVGALLGIIRSETGCHNLAKKTMIDRRFLI